MAVTDNSNMPNHWTSAVMKPGSSKMLPIVLLLPIVYLRIHFDGICMWEGQINTPVVPTSHPGYAVLWSRMELDSFRPKLHNAA